MKKEFIVYPKTIIDNSIPNIQIVEAPLKTKLKAFISAYIEDYGEAPTVERIQSIFHISQQDAEIALVVYRKEAP